MLQVQYQFCYDAIVHFIQTSDTLAVALSRQRQMSVSSAQRQGSRRMSRRGSRSRSSEHKSKNRSPSLSPSRASSIAKATPGRSESVRDSGEMGVAVSVQCHTPVDLVTTEVSHTYGGSDSTSTFGPPRLSQELVTLSQTSSNGPQDHISNLPPGGCGLVPAATPTSPHTPGLTSHSVVANGNKIATPYGTPSSVHVTNNGAYPADASPYLPPSLPHNYSPQVGTPINHSPQVGTPINHTHSPAPSSNLLVSSLCPQDGHFQGESYQHQLKDMGLPTNSASHNTHSGESTQL